MDIEGPVTFVGRVRISSVAHYVSSYAVADQYPVMTINTTDLQMLAKPEHADEYAEYLRQWEHQTRTGIEPYTKNFQAYRYDNTFVALGT